MLTFLITRDESSSLYADGTITIQEKSTNLSYNLTGENSTSTRSNN